MTLAATGTVRAHRPLGVQITEGLLILLGVTALAGGAALVLGLGDGETMAPLEWLEGLPLINSWVVPGLVLGIGFGLGSLFVAYGMLRLPEWPWASFLERPSGHHWSWTATILIGLGHMVWITLELIYLPLSILHFVYGIVGIGLFTLPFIPSVRDHLRVGIR
ncbi:MAG TPA: hypothetical protein VIH55_03875 [Acidimicrobiia bacterium]